MKRVERTTPGSTSATRAPAPSEQDVAMRVRLDAELDQDTIVTVPRASVTEIVQNAEGPSLVGPRISVRYSNVYAQESRGRSVLSLEGLTDPEADTALATSYYAANRVLTMVERVNGAPIAWGMHGRVEIKLQLVPDVRLGSDRSHYSGGWKDITLVHATGATPYTTPREEAAIVFASAIEDVKSAAQRSSVAMQAMQPVVAAFEAIRRDLERGDDVSAQTRIDALLRSPPPLPEWIGTSMRSLGPKLAATQRILRSRGGRRIADPATSRDTAGHESAHALLDALKARRVDSKGWQSFHEGWADLLESFASWDDDALAQRALAETGDDLRRSSIISRLTFGPAERDLADVYTVRADRLDDAAPRNYDIFDDQAAPHALSLPLSSAIYSVFAARANDAMRAAGPDRAAMVEAVRKTRDELVALLLDIAKQMPEGPLTVREVARSAVATAQKRSNAIADDLRQALAARELALQ